MRSITNIFPEPYKISVKHFLSETAQNPMGLGLKPELPESRPKRKRIRRTSKCSSFSRGLRATPFGASVFIHPQRKWFHSEVDLENSEVRVFDLNIPEAQLTHSLPRNRLKPYLERNVSEIIMKCVFQHEIVVNAFRSKRLDRNTVK
ncbi:hypothetical protein AAC387_Pa05g0976 [Persea americana]